MRIRETTKNASPLVAMIFVGVSLLISAGLLYSQLRGERQADVSKAGKMFYSDDDGKTWFLDDASKGSPFDHNGAPAYRALVFRCGDSGRPFVAYLAKYSAEQKSRWSAEAGKDLAGATRVAGEMPRELKKPGEAVWQATPPGMVYPQVTCPNGVGIAVAVSIFDPDSGAK